ncbi:MAG: N-acetylneuraminate synthase family protein [Bacillota bacterium]
MKNFDFDNLFIFDMANNHQGDVKHALKIIKALGKITKEQNIISAFKFQFRDLDTFIHPAFVHRDDVPHIPRFLNTRLNKTDYKVLTEAVRENAMITMATPFDEPSVDLITELGIEVIKIASCSSTDWPLLEKVADSEKPIVISTAGIPMSKIDQLVYYFKNRRKYFALMHCVALYPTDNKALRLNQISLLKNRFPTVPIGFSTHEHPDNFEAIKVSYAQGARLFERHVGLENEKFKLNAYSSTPDQISQWIQAYHEIVAACGGEERAPAPPKEIESLRSLMRGVYAQKELKQGEAIRREDVFFAMPLQEKQLTSGEWKEGLIADRAYTQNEPLCETMVQLKASDEEYVAQIMLQVKGMLNSARVVISGAPSIEVSHHYGLDRFREFGAVIIDCINREYCKKIIVQLPRQKHPYHYHKRKEETFQLLSGDLEIEINGKRHQLFPGDQILVEPEQWHKFHTLDGAIIEEVSTTHYTDDSFYEDEKIARLPREKRKTKVTNWDLL